MTAAAAAVFVSLPVALVGCSDGANAVAGPGDGVRALTGAHTRIVWVQGDGTDPETEGVDLILMGFDSDDGKGERTISSTRGSYVKPRLTARGDRIVFSTRILPGPPEIFVVNWDGSGLRKLADGFAMALWQNPVDGSDWVYAGTDGRRYDFATVTRFPIDAAEKRELVWNATPVSMEGFAVTADGRHAGGLFPWPEAGVADLAAKTWKKFGEGCWTSLTNARGPLFYFDGAYRNVTMVDVPPVRSGGHRQPRRFDGRSVASAGRSTRFLTHRPANQGAPIRRSGKQVGCTALPGPHAVEPGPAR